MANKQFGEATFSLDDETYTLRVELKAWALAQDELTKGERVPSLDLIGKRLEAGHLLTMIAVFWAALQRHHPSINFDKATELMNRSEGKGAKALVDAIKRSNPDAADLEELGVSANPPVAQATEDRKPRGTGGNSTSKRAA